MISSPHAPAFCTTAPPIEPGTPTAHSKPAAPRLASSPASLGIITPDSGATGDSGTTDGGTIEELIPQELKDELDRQLPKGTREDLQNQAEDAIRQGLDGLINP